MNRMRYPRLTMNLDKLRENAAYVADQCEACGIEVTGVVKGFFGVPEISREFLNAGIKTLASSRVRQLARLRESGIDARLLLIRIPMMREIPDVIRYADGSLNSEVSVLRALDEEAGRQGKIHDVILMDDIGDLREGFWERKDLIECALAVEKEMPNLYLKGIGTNVGCYGSLVPTKEKLQELVDDHRAVEEAVGRTLDICSGGATSSLMRVFDGDMPEGINHLRIGEGIIVARDLDKLFGYDLSKMHEDIFRLEAEIVEVKDKPTYPVGTLGVDAFGHRPVYEDRGIRRRAIAALGKADFGSSPEEIFPLDSGVTVIGASSDHTLLDVEDADRDFHPGDIVSFAIDYASMLYLTNTPEVSFELVHSS
ncbi:MAG: alanine/ornithine racemase family PLP-dependent enzyme [Eubacteriales bacterium]|nr:alanine/ornithine racemase family PLP-dependent enzyme [Eubacteriales bacterium]